MIKFVGSLFPGKIQSVNKTLRSARKIEMNEEVLATWLRKLDQI